MDCRGPPVGLTGALIGPPTPERTADTAPASHRPARLGEAHPSHDTRAHRTRPPRPPTAPTPHRSTESLGAVSHRSGPAARLPPVARRSGPAGFRAACRRHVPAFCEVCRPLAHAHHRDSRGPHRWGGWGHRPVYPPVYGHSGVLPAVSRSARCGHRNDFGDGGGRKGHGTPATVVPPGWGRGRDPSRSCPRLPPGLPSRCLVTTTS
jgi:hypothetical protein